MHHLNTQISPPFDSYINKQTVPVCVWIPTAHCCGYFLRHVRRPRMLRLSSIGSAGCS